MMLITLATLSHYVSKLSCNIYANAAHITHYTVRQNIKNFEADYEKSENDIKALQSVGQIVGEVTRQLDEERCEESTQQ